MARSNASPANTPVCPPLPAGSFDLNDLHDAAMKGKDFATLIAPTAETAEAASPEPTPPADGADAA